LNRYPSLKHVFNHYINQGYFENIRVEYVPGATPTAYFYNDSGDEIEQVALGDINVDQLKELLGSHGFELRRPKLVEPKLVSETTIGGIHYKFYGDGKLYNSDAQEFANSQTHNGQKGRLLTIPCKNHEEKIREWIQSIHPETTAWLGAYDAESEGFWKWSSTGDLFWTQNAGHQSGSFYTNWREGEPNNADGNEHCATFVVTRESLGWNDVNCDSANQLILEFGPVESTECDQEPVITSVQVDTKVDHQEVNL